LDSLSIFCKNLHDSFVKRFCSVFELPSLRNTRKYDKTKQVEEKLTSKFLSIFQELSWKKVFDMDFLQFFSSCFWTPLTAKCPKMHTKKNKEGNILGLVGSSEVRHQKKKLSAPRPRDFDFDSISNRRYCNGERGGALLTLCAARQRSRAGPSRCWPLAVQRLAGGEGI
jgi:hypothetical protein